MTLRVKLTVAFALFAAIPMLAPVYWVGRVLSEALAAEYAARFEGATSAIVGEVARLSSEVSASARDVAHSPEVEALSRDHAAGMLDPAEAAGRAREWMSGRGLDVLAVATPEGRVVSSGHLAGRAGDLDPEIRSLFAELEPGAAAARFVSCATPAGVKPVLALVAWESIAGGLRAVVGVALGSSFAERLSTLTGGSVTLVDEKTTQPLASSAPDPALLSRIYSWFFEVPEGRTQAIPLGVGEKALARIEVSLSAAGLAEAGNTVALAFLSALTLAVVAASLAGHLLARRITRPLEALRRGAVQVASGDLSVRVPIGATGEVGDLVGAFNSMTEDLASIRRRAAAAERVAAWREVARRLAHEIKNPLTPIAMSVATLRDAFERNRPDFGEIFKEGTGAIQEEVTRLTRIVDEFSRFARLPPPELAPTAAEEIVDSLLVRYPAPPAGVRIERDVAPHLPMVNADRDQMLQVFLNLASNALEAMGSTGGLLRVSARCEGSDVAFSLADTGPGISPQNLPSIFEPYFTTKEGGTGLGLAIVDRIVSEHGGRIDVDSKEGSGTTFTVRLPAC